MANTSTSDCVISPEFLRQLAGIVGTKRLLSSQDELLVYECDGYVVEKNVPDVVVFPEDASEVAAIVKACVQHDVPFVPRGAGTSLAGGCLPVGGGVMIALTRMREILEINLRDRYAIVEPGVVNVNLTRALAGTGFHYAPDPSSQGACTIGGNVATNSGGPHTLKYGVTVNHVIGIEFVSPEGELIQLGGPCGNGGEFDLTGLFVGSEGTFGVVTKVWVKITRNPAAYRTMLAIFDSIDDTTQAISNIIGAGHCSCGAGNDGQRHRRSPRRKPFTSASRSTPKPCCSSKSTASKSPSMQRPPPSPNSAKKPEPAKFACRKLKKIVRYYGSVVSRHSGRLGV